MECHRWRERSPGDFLAPWPPRSWGLWPTKDVCGGRPLGLSPGRWARDGRLPPRPWRDAHDERQLPGHGLHQGGLVRDSHLSARAGRGVCADVPLSTLAVVTWPGTKGALARDAEPEVWLEGRG